MSSSTLNSAWSVESNALEFKRNLFQSRQLLKTLAVFANTAGGRLVVVHLAQAIRTRQTTEQVARFMAILKDDPVGTREDMDSLGFKHRPAFSANYLQSEI